MTVEVKRKGEDGDNAKQWLQDADPGIRSVANGAGEDSRSHHQRYCNRIPSLRLRWYN